MEAWLQLVVPVCVIFIMAAMGLELTGADFRRVASAPRAAAVGLCGQMLLLPALGFAFALAPGRLPGLPTPLEPELAVGIVVIAACPGSAPSNIFTYLARANIALSISLTAISSLLTVITIPLWVNLALQIFFGAGTELHMPLGRTLVQLASVTLVPVGLGILLRARRPELAARLKQHLRRAVPGLFAFVLIVIAITQWEGVARDLPVAGPTAIVMALCALTLGYGTAVVAGLDRRDAFTISIEVGLQNGALASLIVVNLLMRPEILVFPGAYALLAALPAVAWTFWFRSRTSFAASAV